MRQWTLFGLSVGLCLALTGMSACAQAVAANAPAMALQGKTLAGAPFDLASTRGKVTMVFFWSAKCSVCLSHMPELRANLSGWRGKAFELVTVNVDPDMADWQSYEQITAKLEAVRPTTIWTGKAVASKLPLTLVLNAKGQVLARHEGRIAPEAWDQVADALP